MPWQAQVADVALEVDRATGRMAHELVVVTVPRQAGKSSLIGPLCIARTLEPHGRAWHTAQTRNDARDAWIQELDVLEMSPLAAGFRSRLTNGSETLTARATRGTWRPFAPTRAGLHGKQSDIVVIDEGWAFDMERGLELIQAIVPTQATRRRPQTWVFSTAGTPQSTWLKALVSAGRQSAGDRASKTAYFEWSLSEDEDPLDLDAVCAAHPAYGYTIGREAIEAAAAIMKDTPGDFARAYGNQWTSAVERVLSAAVWTRAAEERHKLPDGASIVFGVDISPDRTSASIVAAARLADGRVILELVDHREGEGIAWVAERVITLTARQRPRSVVVDPIGACVTLVDELSRTPLVPLLTTTTREVAGACLAFYDAVTEGPTVAVRPHPALDDAAAAAGKRTLGGAWAWSRPVGGEVSISPLVAATLAHWGVTRPEQSSPYIL